jgi:thiopeptide-type bacteriocin biosynthesis protein
MSDEHRTGWISAHLFTRGAVYGNPIDGIILDFVAPFVRECRLDALIERYFYIRYGKGGSHVRLRLFGDLHTLQSQVSSLLVSRAETEPTIRHLEWIAYEPELARYGGAFAMAVAEEIFCASSDTAIELLARVRSSEKGRRLGQALAVMIVTAHAFCPDRELTGRFFEHYHRSYLKAIVRDLPETENAVTMAFDEAFERQSAMLRDYVEQIWFCLSNGESVSEPLDAYNATLVAQRPALRELWSSGRFPIQPRFKTDWNASLNLVVPSYIHMMNNRIGVSVREETYLARVAQLALASGSDISRQS